MYQDAVTHGEEQFTISSIPNGVRIDYLVGNMDIGLYALPRFICAQLFNDLIYEHLDPPERFWLDARWRPQDLWPEDVENTCSCDDCGGHLRMIDQVFNRPIEITRMLGYFNDVGWTMEMTDEQNALMGYVPDISFDLFSSTIEIVLDGDRMIVNVPSGSVATLGEDFAQIFAIDVLRFFGAGNLNDEGFILVPSGSGGVINFNNDKYREMHFSAPVYGVDFLNESFFPELVQPARLPVFGINNNGAAFLAHVYSGQAIATVNANVAGRTVGVGSASSQNHAWFNFQLRNSHPLTMGGLPGAASGNMRVVQELAYTGDITVMYEFIAGDNPGVGEMAQAYQNFLIEQGALTPLPGPGDRSLYIDVLGAMDVIRHILGTPYTTLEMMTSMEDANRFVDIFNQAGINTIQMQLHGWFNRGVNHDVAKRVNLINGVGTPAQLRAMNNRLQANGGGLHPGVNFTVTNLFSRNFNTSFEASRDVVGWTGAMARIARDMLWTRSTMHRNDVFVLVHPAVIPFHLDSFIPNFQRRTGLDGLALLDMGDILTESAYRLNPIDREHSRLLMMNQMGRLQDAIPNLVVYGGNDYAFPFASHLVNVPTETDRFFIIDYEVPFYNMVVHGFIEFAGATSNLRENFDPLGVLLNSMTTGASPMYMLTAQPTRLAQFSPHERFYSTHYVNWMDQIIWHYTEFNNVYRYLRGERMVDFQVLAGRRDDIMTASQVTVSIFSNGTRIYVNNTQYTFEYNGVVIPPRWFTVVEGA
jgi:hypothetical protein